MTRKKRASLFQPTLAFLLTATVFFTATALAENNDEMEIALQETRSAKESNYQTILTHYKNTETIKPFESRLQRLSEVGREIVSRLEASINTSLDDMLMDIAGLNPSSKPSESTETARLTGLDLLTTHEEIFSQPIDFSVIPDTDRLILQKHYQTIFNASLQPVFKKAHIAASGDDSRKIGAVELALVLPFLHTPDSSWTHNETEQLPSWLLDPTVINAVEKTSLRAGRTRTAYEISLAVRRRSDARTREDYIRYLRQTALNAVKEKDPPMFWQTMHAAIDLASEGDMIDNVAELSYQMADGLNTMGHPELAADHMRWLLDRHPDLDSFPKAALLYMRYLHDAERFDDIVSETNRYKSDARCAQHLSRILYVEWVAYRRLGKEASAEQLQKEFLAKHPNDPLGADMLFADAMTALAASNYGRASQLLEQILYEYPESRLTPRVIKVREQLDSASKTRQ